jgi:hypothetical protein
MVSLLDVRQSKIIGTKIRICRSRLLKEGCRMAIRRKQIDLRRITAKICKGSLSLFDWADVCWTDYTYHLLGSYFFFFLGFLPLVHPGLSSCSTPHFHSRSLVHLPYCFWWKICPPVKVNSHNRSNETTKG